MRWLALAAALCACPAPYALTPVLIPQPGQTANATQSCVADPALAPLADLALVLLAREAISAGYNYERTAAAIRSPVVCLVARPEPCCSPADRSACQAGGVKAGCAGDGWCWVSREWPAGTVRDYRGDLLHELSHVLAFALLAEQRADHAAPWSAIEARALKAFLAATE